MGRGEQFAGGRVGWGVAQRSSSSNTCFFSTLLSPLQPAAPRTRLWRWIWTLTQRSSHRRRWVVGGDGEDRRQAGRWMTLACSALPPLLRLRLCMPYRQRCFCFNYLQPTEEMTRTLDELIKARIVDGR